MTHLATTDRIHVTFDAEIVEIFRAMAAKEGKPVATIVRKLAVRQLFAEMAKAS